jgi:putative ubiquitin-RnfH superfamily antitoxin RatB of RatAB toxin-antitoxin module
MADAPIHVTVVYSPTARQVLETPVELAPGSTVLQAIGRAGASLALDNVDLRLASVGVWGRKATLEQGLREGDRVEIYRPLEVDPKVARRERFRKQGVRAAGLFARRKDTAPREA